MIKAIHFKNYKALRDTTLPLGRFTLLIGPNNSGKTTALEAIRPDKVRWGEATLSAGVRLDRNTRVLIELEWCPPYAGVKTRMSFRRPSSHMYEHHYTPRAKEEATRVQGTINASRLYCLDAAVLASPVELKPRMEMSANGQGLAGVLDRLRDEAPERFEALNDEFGRWLPEFDRVLFDTPKEGHRAIKLRTRIGQHAIPAADVSQGTLLALAILTLAYLPDPPPIVGLEEPGRGIHPRLLRDVRDAMYRLAYPESCGEKREPVQVIATTHSPYLLDLFRDHPEEIVIANKTEDNVTFTRLSDLPNAEEILADAALGEVWYSGILGGVPGDK